MLARSYFDSVHQNNARRHLINCITRSARFRVPPLATSILSQIQAFCTQHRTVEVPDCIAVSSLPTKFGDLQVYRIGEGPVILFLHGSMEFSSQFFSLMQKVADMGYCALAFNQSAHGTSGGSEWDLPILLEAKRSIIESLRPQERLVATVSHSIGSVVALDFMRNDGTDHFMISPLFGYSSIYQEQMETNGLGTELSATALAHIEKQYDFSYNLLNNMARVAQVNGRVHIVHSRGDQIAPVEVSRELAKRFHKVCLQERSGNSHERLINAQSTVAALSDFLDSSKSPENTCKKQTHAKRPVARTYSLADVYG